MISCPPWPLPALSEQILAAAERAGRLTPSFMSALAATLGCSPSNTMVVAGGHTMMVRGDEGAQFFGLGGRVGVAQGQGVDPMVHAGGCTGCCLAPSLAGLLPYCRTQPPAAGLGFMATRLICMLPAAPGPLAPVQEAGKSVGMLALGVPPSVAMRGGFSAADAIFDGFGAGGGLTWRKARLILDRRNAQQGSA